ncbi:MAG: imidazole glycerol phosphate synthase subunit HisH [Pseudomonadota bacterium]
MTEKIAIIDYGSGNLRSVEKAFERAAQETGANALIVQTDDPAAIAGADRVVLPGVGAFGACAAGLKARKGVPEALQNAVLAKKRPFLGICVGMQLMAEHGEEYGRHEGLGWVGGAVRPLADDRPDMRTPHMGWNRVSCAADHPVLEGLDGAEFYFAHSYHLVTDNDPERVATADYGGPVTAAVARDNLIGVQFHPEKSQKAGLALIGNFLKWRSA